MWLPSAATAQPPAYAFAMLGGQVVPPTVSRGFGTCVFNLTPLLDTLIYSIDYHGLGGGRTSLDIHSGFFGQTGPVVLNLSPISGGTSDSLAGRIFWPPALRPLVQDLNNPVAPLYVEIDTQSYPAGEIRGQFVRPSLFVPVKATTWGRLRRENLGP